MKFKMYFEDINNRQIIKEYITDSIEKVRETAVELCRRMEITGPGRGWAFRVDVVLDKEKLIRQYKGDMSKEEVKDAIDTIEDAINFG